MTPAADDVILGGRGNDMLFGDALNADYLLGDEYTWEGKDTYVKGSSWDIINAYLVATLGHNPSEGEIAKFIAQNADKLGLTDTVADSAGVVRGGNDTLLGGSGDDIVYGQGGNDLIFGDGSDTASSGTPIGTLNTLDNLLPEAEAGTDGSYAERIHALGAPGTQEQPSKLDMFASSLEGAEGIEKDTDGNDLLFGGSGDDVIFGMGGNDYIDGGEGSDIIFAGSGNDIIVYDKSDYLVDGGSGIDVMVHDGTLSLDALLGGDGAGNGPIVNDVEVLITGKDALSLTSMDELSKVGITITHGEGGDTLSLSKEWTLSDTNTTDDVVSYTHGGLTVQIDMDAMSQSETDQMVFILNNANG